MSAVDIDSPSYTNENFVKAKLEEHKSWLKGETGSPAIFHQEHLTELGEVFQGHDLRKIVFDDVDLDGTSLVDTDLTGVDLSSTHNLIPDQFAGAVLRNAKLPEQIDFTHGLRSVEEVSKVAGRILASLLITCAYSWLTIASTKDVDLLANRATSSLPLIGVTIPIVSFYLAAPFVLLGVFIYFCLQLHRLWVELATLPAIFPDGIPLDRKAYPSTWAAFVSITFDRLVVSHRNRAQVSASAFITWGIVPISLLHIWAKYLRCHDRVGTALHIICILFSILIGLISFHACLERLKTHKPVKRAVHPTGPFFTIILLVILFLLTRGSFLGGPPELYSRSDFDKRAAHIPWNRFDYRAWVPQFLGTIPGATPFADITDAELSIAPPGWNSDGINGLSRVHGVQLKNRDLRFLNGTRAFMVGTSFLHSDLYGVNFWNADLRGCSLANAKADNSILYLADLRAAKMNQTSLINADMRLAQLREADLTGANLFNADLTGADCFHATFTKTNLTGAILKSANIQFATFNGAIFDAKSIQSTHNWKLARYWDNTKGTGTVTLTRDMHLPENHNIRVSKRDLSNYDLRKADLTSADLTGYNLKGAHLDGAILTKAILSGAIGLTVEQLATAKVDYMTSLPNNPPITLEQIEEARKKLK